MDCEAVIITNGRSSFRYAHKALRQQTARCKIHVIRNMPWVEANNHALEVVKAPLMLRVDDDMFLHPRALEFLLQTMRCSSVMHRGKLYEPHTRRIAGRTKIYRVEAVKAIGGFRANRLGKIDRMFERDAGADNITIADKRTPVGIHSCPPWREQRKYEALWGHKKSTRMAMKLFRMPLRAQYDMRIWKIERTAKQRDSKFWRWLNIQNQRQAGTLLFEGARFTDSRFSSLEEAEIKHQAIGELQGDLGSWC